MGDYATISDVQGRIPADMLVSLTVDTRPIPQGATPDTAKIEEAIAEAEATVNAYLEPVTPVPASAGPRLRGLALAIARWLLFSRRNEVSRHDDVAKDYDRAMRELRDISERKLRLGDSDAPFSGSVRFAKPAATGRYDDARSARFRS